MNDLIDIDADILDFYKGEIVDCHNHLFTPGIMETLVERVRPATLEKYAKRFKVPKSSATMEKKDVLAVASSWVKDMDRLSIDKIVWFPFKGAHRYVYEVAAAHPDRVLPFFWMDMIDPGGMLGELEDGILHHGVKGIKINPSADHVHPHDPRMYPVYELLEAHGLTVLSHYGISMAPMTDVAYINPLDIQVAARDFPGVNFIVAHMGAGFIRESLFLIYHDFNENIYFDTSGSGAWLNYMPFKARFEDVFARFIEASNGVEKLLFATDSNMRGYRAEILKQSLQIFKNLGLSLADVTAIMAGNAKRIFRL